MDNAVKSPIIYDVQKFKSVVKLQDYAMAEDFYNHGATVIIVPTPFVSAFTNPYRSGNIYLAASQDALGGDHFRWVFDEYRSLFEDFNGFEITFEFFAAVSTPSNT